MADIKVDVKADAYPQLKISGDCVVLFTAAEIGAVVSDLEGRYGIGHWCEDWDMNEFEPFEDQIILHN